MEEAVVYAGATGARGGKDLVCLGLGTEGVYSERCFMGVVGDLYGLVKVVDAEDWHKRTEGFIHHQRIFRVGDQNHGWLNEPLLCIGGTSSDYLSGRRVEHFLDSTLALKVAVVAF